VADGPLRLERHTKRAKRKSGKSICHSAEKDSVSHLHKFVTVLNNLSVPQHDGSGRMIYPLADQH